MSDSIYFDKRVQNGMSYEEFLDTIREKVDAGEDGQKTENDKKLFGYVELNYSRKSRIAKTYTPSDAIRLAMEAIDEPQFWLVITEDWCGDSAQNLPYIVAIAELNPLITLKIVQRDANLDIMDMYLTNGSRSIPKLVAFDSQGDELFQWGPRPKVAMELVKKLKDSGETSAEFIPKIHSWYTQDKGASLEKEFQELLSK
jgi:hypothetical protein